MKIGLVQILKRGFSGSVKELNTEPSGREVSILIPSLPLLPGLLWPEVVVLIVPCIVLVKLFNYITVCKQMIDFKLNCLCYIIIIIIIIMLHCQHGSPWPSLTIHLYRPLLPEGLQCYTLYRHRGCPNFARPCEEVHRSMSLMSSSLLLQQCPACLVRLTWTVFVMGGRRPFRCCLVGCCLQDLFNIARSSLV